MAATTKSTSGSEEMKPKEALYQKLIAHVNRKEWWHVPPQDPKAYAKRGKFLASSFREAEFWGRPLDEPQRVEVALPLVGDEESIERMLFGRRVSHEDIEMEERWALDAKLKAAALAKGYDSIVLMTPKAFSEFSAGIKLPRSMELNILKEDKPPTEKRRLRGRA
jgi:hypothetical protein